MVFQKLRHTPVLLVLSKQQVYWNFKSALGSDDDDDDDDDDVDGAVADTDDD